MNPRSGSIRKYGKATLPMHIDFYGARVCGRHGVIFVLGQFFINLHKTPLTTHSFQE
jgi:hypothetical protein